jgi:hypothetical protein
MRHDNACAAIAATLKAAGGAQLLMQREPRVRDLGHLLMGGLRAAGAASLSRADLLLQHAGSGEFALADLSFTSPCLTHNITAAKEVDGAALAKRTAQKHKHYATLVVDPNGVTPFVFETGGRMSDGGFIAKAVRLALGLSEDEAHGTAYARLLASVRTRLSVAHWRANALNARKLLTAVRRRAEGGGGFLPPVGAGGLGGGAHAQRDL